MKYYFVSYSFSNSMGSGFGSCYTFYEDFFKNDKETEQIKFDRSYNAITILFYKEISKQEYEANIKSK